MTGVQIQYQVEDAVSGAMAILAARLGNTTPVMREIGGYVETVTVLRFDTETGPGGRKWPQSLRARLTGGQTLTDSARLRQSITHRAGPDHAEIGTNVVYAAIHQFGGTIRAKSARALVFTLPDGSVVQLQSVTIPARPFMGIDEDNWIAIGDIVTDWLTEAGGAP